jgi:hypothetical protein
MMVDGLKIEIESTLKVLGITFDRKMNWEEQIQRSIEGAMRAKQGIGIIAKHLTCTEIRVLSTALFYSRLYYGSRIWMQEDMPKKQLQKLMNASTSMLKICLNNKWIKLPQLHLHKHFNQATPMMMRDYSTAKTLYDTITTMIPNSLLPTLVYNFLESRRHKGTLFTSSNSTNIGKNSLPNRVTNITKRMNEPWHEMPPKVFKKFAKKIFISNELNTL